MSLGEKIGRRLGFLAVPHLSAVLAGMIAAAGFLSSLRPAFIGRLILNPEAVWRGEAWRLFTFLLVPSSSSPLWLLVWALLVYFMARAVEAGLGESGFTLFFLVGTLALGTASLALGEPISSFPFYLSLFLAFAKMNPDAVLMFFFVVPVRVKWLFAAGWAYAAVLFALGNWGARITLACGLANYLLFFGEGHWSGLKLFLHHRIRSRRF